MMELGAPPEPLLYALVALAAVHLAASLVARAARYWLDGARRRGTERAGGDGTARPDDAEQAGDVGRDAGAGTSVGADAVQCPNCGTTNERGYRFCRACVTELPGPDGRATPAESVWSGTLP